MNFSDTELRELLPLVALGMATAAEREAVSAVLKVDASLRLEYAQVQRALSGIPQAVAPPPALKARLLEAIRKPESVPLEPRPAPSRTAAHSLPARASGRNVPRRALWGGLAAAVAVMALAVTVLLPRAVNVGAAGAVVATTGDGGLIVGDASASNEVGRCSSGFVAEINCLDPGLRRDDG